MLILLIAIVEIKASCVEEGKSSLRQRTVSFPDYSNNYSLADDIGEFFCSKIHNIRTELDSFEVTVQDRAMFPEEAVVKDIHRLQ